MRIHIVVEQLTTMNLKPENASCLLLFRVAPHTRGRTDLAFLQGAACKHLLVAPWLAHLGVHRPRPSSYMGLAGLSLLWRFLSPPPPCISFRLSCIAFTVVLFYGYPVGVANQKSYSILSANAARRAGGYGRGGARGHAGRAGGRESAAHAARPRPKCCPISRSEVDSLCTRTGPAAAERSVGPLFWL